MASILGSPTPSPEAKDQHSPRPAGTGQEAEPLEKLIFSQRCQVQKQRLSLRRAVTNRGSSTPHIMGRKASSFLPPVSPQSTSSQAYLSQATNQKIILRKNLELIPYLMLKVFCPKIRNKTLMMAVTTSIPHCTRNPSQCSETRGRKKIWSTGKREIPLFA